MFPLFQGVFARTWCFKYFVSPIFKLSSKEPQCGIALFCNLVDVVSILEAERQIRCVKWISIDANSFISWPNPIFDHLLESSRWDDSNKWSNRILSRYRRFRNEDTHLIWSPADHWKHEQMLYFLDTCIFLSNRNSFFQT